MDDIRKLPGAGMTMSGIAAKAAELGIARPEGFYSSHNTRIWTLERDAYLRNNYENGTFPDLMLRRLNALRGDAIAWNLVPPRARLLGLRRPADYTDIMRNYMSRKLRNPRWTDERENALVRLYPTYSLPKDILDELLALSGPDDLDWECVRDRAKNLNLRRPVDFRRWHQGELLRREREIVSNNR